MLREYGHGRRRLLQEGHGPKEKKQEGKRWLVNIILNINNFLSLSLFTEASFVQKGRLTKLH